MKPNLPLALLLLLTSAGTDYADPVELNGLACLFGENMAFMVLHPAGQSKPVSFTLSEGGSRFGVTLLSVDLANHRAQIEQSGEVQSLRLCSAPHSPMSDITHLYPVGSADTRLLTPQEQMQLDQFLSQDQEVQSIKSGNPVLTDAYSGPAYPGSTKSDAASGNSSGSSSPGSAATTTGSGSSVSSGSSIASTGAAVQGTGDSASASSAASGLDASSSTVDYTKQNWYVTSLNIERNRLATANDVMTGVMLPLPRTPLTPAQTPPQLVGNEVYFSTHIPGFVDNSTPD